MERKVKDFTRSECRKIAIGYATTADDLTASYFGMLYQTSPEVIYGVIRRAVVESMVGEKVVRLISNKAGRNSSNHGGEGGRRRSTEKYQRLMERRGKFEFSKDNKEFYAIEYANSDQAIDMKVFSELHCMSRSLLQRTLVSAVVDNIVSDEVVEKLYQKALQHNPSWRVSRLFRDLKNQRQKNIEEKKARQKERRLQRKVRGEEDEVQALLDELMLDPENEEKRKQLDFIQVTMADYGIPDEMAEQLASLEVARQELMVQDEEYSPEESEDNSPIPNQLSFLDDV